MRDRFIPFGAEDKPHGRVLTGMGPMLLGKVQIEIHLASVGVGEFPGFEIDENEAFQTAVKKHQVNAVPFIPDAQALLASYEGEVIAEFEEEVLEVKNQRFFQR